MMLTTLIAAATLNAAPAQPSAFLDAHPDWMELRAKAIELATKHIENLDGWQPQMTCYPGSGIIWQWDSCFMSLYAGYTPGRANGLGNLDNLYKMQRADGYISMAYTYATREPTYGERVNPPLYAWCEWLYARRTGDLSRLPRAYEACSKFYRWLKQNRARKFNGLYWFEDSGSSGMDNSPRCGYFAEHQKGSDVCFVDLSCQQVLSARCLAKIAPLVGKGEEAAGWRREAETLSERINEIMWSEQTGFYHDVYIDTNNKLAVKTVAGFWPLVAGVATAERAARLVEHLQDPCTFGTEFPVPSLSADDPNFDPQGGYWLGGCWPPTNYMVVQGLKAYGYRDLARTIAARHLDQMYRVFKSDKYRQTIWECYAPAYNEPATGKIGDLCRHDFVGWGGIGPILMLVEDIIGLDVNAIEKRIEWHPSELGRQGVANIPFNGGTVSLTADVDSLTRNSVKVTAETDRPFTLKVVAPGAAGRLFRKQVKPGKSEFNTRESYGQQDTPIVTD